LSAHTNVRGAAGGAVGPVNHRRTSRFLRKTAGIARRTVVTRFFEYTSGVMGTTTTRVVIVGGAFGGVQCARTLRRRLTTEACEIVVFNREVRCQGCRTMRSR
jgi:hypothetical protein